jgi:alpha-L-arabinofuranosidase
MTGFEKASLKNGLPHSILGVLCVLAVQFNVVAAEVSITIDVANPAHRISPRLYGVFFEDINFGGDGGLNAELVKNGSFEFPQHLMGWSAASHNLAKADVLVKHEAPAFAANPHYLSLRATSRATEALNEGYRGIGVREGERYVFSAHARSDTANTTLNVMLVVPGGRTLASAEVTGIGTNWSEHSAVLTPDATSAKAQLVLMVSQSRTVDVDLVSLYPEKTWKGRPHGLRADLIELLAELKPAFLRFPGGCIVEGSDLSRRYQWKTTIGDRPDRRLIINRWNSEFAHRPAPDYFQSFGLGFYEYFLLAEDLGAEPLPILNCGMACQFNTGELAPLEELGPYIEDALDLIEFANGAPTTTWGAKRAAMGHPEPFGMKLLGVGNEQWGPQYFERYKRFADVLTEKHPEIELISGSGPFPADENFRFAWQQLRELKAEIVDEHCYAMPDWFLRSATRYDNYDPSGPKVFMGEYAAQSVDIASPDNRNNLRCALAEAAFMTGLERNSDVVVMSSYAPLLGHEEAWQWRPNLIWLDNLAAYATPNFYVQQMFSRNRGDVVLPVELTDSRPAEPAAGRIGLATDRSSAEFRDVRIKVGDQTLDVVEAFNDESKRTTFRGNWTARDGIIHQTDRRAVARVQFGDHSWKDCTLSLKVRKLAGRGGFGVIVRNSPGGSYLQWNLGAANNSQHSFQANLASHSVDDTTIERKAGSIESGQWYDLKIELQGSMVRCYVNGELIHDLDLPPPNLPRLFATASRDTGAGEVILKVVNPTGENAEVDVNLQGVSGLESHASAIVLQGNPEDENSIGEPQKIAPKSQTLDARQPRFNHSFPPYSLSVLRLDVKDN